MTVYVLVPMEEGIVRGVRAFRTETAAQTAATEWLHSHGIHEDTERNDRSDWGTGVAVWECALLDEPIIQARRPNS